MVETTNAETWVRMASQTFSVSSSFDDLRDSSRAREWNMTYRRPFDVCDVACHLERVGECGSTTETETVCSACFAAHCDDATEVIACTQSLSPQLEWKCAVMG